jgi:hypothetical protein
LRDHPRIHRLAKFCRSQKALAIPVTFLILFVSTLFMVAVAYNFAVERINARSQDIRVSLARENMMSLDEELSSILWQQGSSRTFGFGDCGGQLNVEPSTNPLSVKITDNNNISASVFNSTVGWVVYELPYSETADTGLFLRGDSRAIVNQISYGMTQLCIRMGLEHPEILLQYRPILSYSTTNETEDNKPVNNVRIYIVSLNSSQTIELMGEVPLKMTCHSTESSVTFYKSVSYRPEALLVNATVGEFSSQVSVPISSSNYGAIINVEVVLTEVQIDRTVT